MYLCLFNRFLMKLLIKRQIITSAGIAPSGTTGLRKPPGPLLPACLFSLLASVWTPRTCDLPQENAIFQTRLSIAASGKRIFCKYKQLHWFAFGNAKATTCFSWKVPVPLGFCQSTVLLWGHLWAVDSEAFSGVQEKGGRTRIGKPNHPDTLPRE